MRRMLTDPGEIIECSFENLSNRSVVYVPNVKLEDLPISFEFLIITAENSTILSLRVTILYKSNYGEVRGGGIFTTWEGNSVILTANPDSLLYPEFPLLTMDVKYIRGDMTRPPIPDGAHVFIRNIVHLSKQMNEIK